MSGSERRNVVHADQFVNEADKPHEIVFGLEIKSIFPLFLDLHRLKFKMISTLQ